MVIASASQHREDEYAKTLNEKQNESESARVGEAKRREGKPVFTLFRAYYVFRREKA